MSGTAMRAAFDFGILTLKLEAILPIRQVKASDHAFGKYKAMVASIREVGVIEPLVVHPQKGNRGSYVLLDGHMRLKALLELGRTETDCLVATDDDAFTYNDKVNRLSIIQEHAMITRAIENGVTPAQIAKALAVDVAKITSGMNLLDDIHPDAVEILKDKPITAATIRLFKRVKAVRQIDMAQLMVSGNNFTQSYAKALLIGTNNDQRVKDGKAKTAKGVTPENLARMEREMESLEKDYRLYQDQFGENSLHLNAAHRYVGRLMGNAKVRRFLTARYPEILEEFQDLAELESI